MLRTINSTEFDRSGENVPQQVYDRGLSTARRCLLPSDHTEVRRSLNIWFDAKRVHPMFAGGFDDSALMFCFGRTGAGVFPAPTLIEEALRREMNLQMVGRARDVREHFYAITLEETPQIRRW